MIHGKKLIVILPARNVRSTVARTLAAIPEGFVDEMILGDNQSTDETGIYAQSLEIKNLTVLFHPANLGYGGNVKALCLEALRRDADVIVMLHPDFQYPPAMVIPIASMIAAGQFDLVVGSRVVGDRSAIACGMPVYRYLSNRILTIYQNVMTGTAASELHSGMRGMSRSFLTELPIAAAHDGFGFDNDLHLMGKWFGRKIGEVSAPTNYAPDTSSNPFRGALKYGVRCIAIATRFRLARWRLMRPSPLFTADRRANGQGVD